MSVITLFLKDHEELRAHLTQIDKIRDSDPKTAEQFVGVFKKILDRHTYEEEHFLYPETKKKEATRPDTLEGWEEHRIVGQLFSEMNQLPIKDEKWLAKFKVMKESLLHHLKEEEEELFPDAEKALSKELMEELEKKAMTSRQIAV